MLRLGSKLCQGSTKTWLKENIKINDREIILINYGNVFAIENLYPVMNLLLDFGRITWTYIIVCPYQNSEFCFKTSDFKKWVRA